MVRVERDLHTVISMSTVEEDTEKVYTADKPRLGINHPNHIGAFWYKESIVGDIREGIVHKDYKVESEEE